MRFILASLFATAATISIAQAATVEILPGGPLPLPDQQAEASVFVRTSVELPSGQQRDVNLPDRRTVNAGVSEGFTSISGSVSGQQLQAGMPDSTGFEAMAGPDRFFYSANADSVALVTVPNLGVSPEIQTQAEVNIERAQDTRNNRRADAAASGALAYQAKLNRIDGSALGLMIDFAPISVTILADMEASVTPGDFSDIALVARGSASVLASVAPISVNDAGGLDFDASLTDVLFSESVNARSDGTTFQDLDDRLKTTSFGADIQVGQDLYIGKTATSNVDALLKLPQNISVTASAQAVVDPVFSFDQARFDQLYGEQCLQVLGTACPAMDTLFSLSLSPFVGNGFGPSVSEPGPAPVPLPLSAAFLLTAVAGMGLTKRRAQPAG
ncbi:MAG: hypothetical protein AAFN51_00325 [Pseudomonadota bacterium]